MTQTLDIPLVSIYQKIHCTIPSETQYIRSPEEGLRIVQPLIADTDREHNEREPSSLILRRICYALDTNSTNMHHCGK